MVDRYTSSIQIPIKMEGSCNQRSMVSRSSSDVGGSSRIYYRSSQGVPFNWEMQPGTPKQAQKEDILRPISPPPAILSQAYPTPNINVHDDDDEKPSSRFYSLYKLESLKRSLKLLNNIDYYGIKEKLRTRLIIIANINNNKAAAAAGKNDVVKGGHCSRSNLDDVEFTASPRRSSFSSSSTTTSSSSSSTSSFSGSVNSCSGRRWSPSPVPARNNSMTRFSNYNNYNGCNPWNISSAIVRVARR